MHSSFSAKSTEARVAALEAEVKDLQHRLGQDQDPQKVVSRHIKLLHQYNEAKDATQVSCIVPIIAKVAHILIRVEILVGRLAQLRQTTIKKIHEDYDLVDEE